MTESPSKSLLISSAQHASLFVAAQKLSKTETCRLCHHEDNHWKLISPCNCTGTMKFAHESCMEEMLETKTTDPFSCGVCGAYYNFTAKDKTLNMIMYLVKWIDGVSMVIIFPHAFFTGNLTLMVACCTLAIAHILTQVVAGSTSGTLTITNKVSKTAYLIESAILAMTGFNMCILFLTYCSTLRWSMDFSRLLPSVASLILCEALAFCIGWVALTIFGAPFAAAEDDILIYAFLLGLSLWSVIRADPEVFDDMCPAPFYQMELFAVHD